MEHGNNGHANIDLGGVHADFDAAVLGDTFFGDVEVTEDFDAGNDGGLKAFDLGGDGNFLEDTVDAIADAEFVFEGFEVDIGGAEFDGVAEDLVDEADDGGVGGGGIEVGIIGDIVIDHLEGRGFVEGVDGIGADAEVFFDFPLDGFGGGEDGLESKAGEGFEGIQRLGGEEAGGGDIDGAVGPSEGQEIVAQEEAGGEQPEHVLVGLHGVERGELDAVFTGHPTEHGLLGPGLGGLGSGQ